MVEIPEPKEAPAHFDDMSPETQAKLRMFAEKSLLMAIDIVATKENVCKGCMARIFFETMLEAFGTKVELATEADLAEIFASQVVKH